MQLITAGRCLYIEYRAIGRSIVLGPHLCSMKSHLVFNFFSLFFRHPTEFYSLKQKNRFIIEIKNNFENININIKVYRRGSFPIWGTFAVYNIDTDYG